MSCTKLLSSIFESQGEDTNNCVDEHNGRWIRPSEGCLEGPCLDDLVKSQWDHCQEETNKSHFQTQELTSFLVGSSSTHTSVLMR